MKQSRRRKKGWEDHEIATLPSKSRTFPRYENQSPKKRSLTLNLEEDRQNGALKSLNRGRHPKKRPELVAGMLLLEVVFS